MYSCVWEGCPSGPEPIRSSLAEGDSTPSEPRSKGTARTPREEKTKNSRNREPPKSSRITFSLSSLGPCLTLGVFAVPSLAQAVFSAAADCKPRNSIAICRRRYFWILPVTVIGNVSTQRQYRGTLNAAKRERQYAFSSSSLGDAPGRGRTQAITSSPYL